MSAARTRILCLGNELLGDDALGPVVAAALRDGVPEGCEVAVSDDSGMRLLDSLLGVERLILVDAVVTGAAPPGTIHRLREEDMATAAGAAQHALSVFDTLALARRLGLDVPREVEVFAVEAADCVTFGAPLHPAVWRAAAEVARLCRETAGAAGLCSGDAPR